MIRAKRPSLGMDRTRIMSSLLIAGLLAGAPVKVIAAAGSFALTGSLNTARYGHSATLLQNGEVLVTGGLSVNGIYDPLASAELYNPATGKWTLTGSMGEGRVAFTATLLPNGEVLVTGGSGYTTSCFATAELYHPSTGQWTSTTSMAQARCYHTATLLPSGEVLVAGGVDSLFNTPSSLAAAELYNPTTGMWQAAGSMNVGRAAAAALLENGQVLVAGGYNTSNGTTTYLSSAELYNPSTGLWSHTASMSSANASPTTPALLANNDVLIADQAQFYNPATAAWVNTGPLPRNAGPPIQASLLNTGNVLASGTRCTYNGCGHVATTGCFLYITSTNSWSIAASMNKPRLGHSSTLLPSGKVLVAGGYSGNLSGPTVLSSAELYTP